MKITGVGDSRMGDAQLVGLALWRQRQVEERQRRLLELERYRADATTEERDGRTYRVVHLPDRYTFGRKDAA